MKKKSLSPSVIDEHTKKIQENIEKMKEYGAVKQKAKEDAYWENIADVDWEDLRFYLEKSRRDKDENSFNTSIRILNALRKQVLERKDK